jgi:predicted DNA-binding ribbon-helix-helix protein
MSGTGNDRAPAQTLADAARHRTSVSLEDAFWDEFRRIAAARGQSVNDLAAEIDAERVMTSGLPRRSGSSSWPR